MKATPPKKSSPPKDVDSDFRPISQLLARFLNPFPTNGFLIPSQKIDPLQFGSLKG